MKKLIIIISFTLLGISVKAQSDTTVQLPTLTELKESFVVGQGAEYKFFRTNLGNWLPANSSNETDWTEPSSPEYMTTKTPKNWLVNYYKQYRVNKTTKQIQYRINKDFFRVTSTLKGFPKQIDSLITN